MQACEPNRSRFLVLQGHPLHGLAGGAVVGLGPKQGVVVGLEIAVVEHHGFDGRQLLPGLRLKQGLGFDLIDKSNEIEVCSVLRLNFVEQVNARVIGKEPVLAVVKLQVHATGGEREHGQHDHCKGLLWTVDTPVSQHHERISHDFCTFFSLITVRLCSFAKPSIFRGPVP